MFAGARVDELSEGHVGECPGPRGRAGVRGIWGSHGRRQGEQHFPTRAVRLQADQAFVESMGNVVKGLLSWFGGRGCVMDGFRAGMEVRSVRA